MGRSSSKLREIPNNPLQELQLKETKREHQKRKREKELKQIAKLQKKQAKKNKKSKKKKCVERNSLGGKRKSSSSTQRLSSYKSLSAGYEINKEEFNRQIENKIQHHLNTDLCTFTMNQIALSLQFFGNYESEVSSIMEELLAKENEFNQNLEEHSILLANPLDAAVAKWIHYKPVHGGDKNNPQLLQPQALYVIFENVDIARPNDANYDSISPLCKVDMETDFYKTTPCKEDYIEMLKEIKWKGYVRLKLRENPLPQRPSSTDEIYTDGSSSYSTTSNYSGRTASMLGSEYGAENDYDYAYIAHLNSHHPLAELKMSKYRERFQLDPKVLPESCVASLGNFIESCHEDTDDEENEETDEEEEEDGYSSSDEREKARYRDYETLQAIKLYKKAQEHRRVLLQQCYLNSKEFMRYFGELVRQQLATQLQLTDEELQASTYRGPSIYTRRYELIPAIHVAQNAQNWPDCAFQFRIRERPISTNPLTGQQFQWPTRSMVKRIETFGFHVIPVGYAPKRQRNPFRELEWRIVFPKAERYLEQHLTHAQVKVFMMAKALVKTFVEPQEKHKALLFTIDHLRTHLFWECERNFTAWPEEFLGEVLVRFIGTFMERLREKSLRDYFIEERNLFESIPEYSLVMLYSILADIIANPLMHLMVAARNMDLAEAFYPKLNFRKIFDNLKENDMMKLKMHAKNARSLAGLETPEDEKLLMVDDGAKGLVGMKQHREKVNGKLRRKTHLMRHNIEQKKKQDYELRRLSVESIDVEYFFTKDLGNVHARHINQGVENLRRTNILEIIIDHLLLMVERSIEMRAAYPAKIYIAQARRLCKFYHSYGCDMGAKEYLTAIHNIDEEVNDLQSNDDFSILPPALPIRSSIEPMRPQQTKELVERLATPKRNIYVELKSKVDDATPPESRRGIKFAAEAHIIENSETPNATPQPRKSIKFIEHVVEFHAGDSNPVQRADISHPVGILRTENSNSNAQHDDSYDKTYAEYYNDNCGDDVSCDDADSCDNDDNGDDEISETFLDNQENPASNDIQADSAFTDNANATTTEESLNNMTSNDETASLVQELKTTAVSIIKNTPFANTKAAKTIATSAGKIMTAMQNEEKRLQFSEILRRKTVQLRGVLNQSSES